MSDLCRNANQALAAMLGWTSIDTVYGALIGTPPPGTLSSRGQALVPDWCGSWNACGPLMVDYACYPQPYLTDGNCIAARYELCERPRYFYVDAADYPTRGHAVRAAVVWAVLEKLTLAVQPDRAAA